jgi:membrane protease YdiL (CAAX protease family)
VLQSTVFRDRSLVVKLVPTNPPRWSALPVGHWRWWYAPVGVLVALGLLWLLLALGWAGVWAQVLQFVLFMAVALLVPGLISRRATALDWCWLPARPWRAAAVVGVLALASFAIVELIEASDPAMAEASATVLRSFGFGRDAALDAPLVLCIVVLAPLAEELLFRGLIYRSLRDGLARHLPLGWGMVAGAAVSAVLFAVAHGGAGQDEQLWLLLGMGLLLVLAHELTGCLAAPIVLHSLNNTLALLTGLVRHPDVRLAQAWIEWLAWSGPVWVMLCVLLLSALYRRAIRAGSA